ncbi:methyl-accepting chemotaxis protein [Selenihalanaerobacter shriftii]|uniref:Methyl-accepting chemotaxis protein n=1 Tax=Selenihalanaerobacter shriftii TaxID=142842 RepID=A0A1T4NRB7_9FIRM|nr:methyl-accepting chemotaxis protein [Selenihalanaerobacter shriftii]SJZ81742.1 methyl-accepting chemotaxis protein [Selenihalanaerobacter shriftii]
MQLIDKEMFDIDVERTLKSRLLLKTLIFSGILGLIGLLLLGIFTYNTATDGFKKLSTEKLDTISNELNYHFNGVNRSKQELINNLDGLNKKEKRYFQNGTGQIYIIDKQGEILYGNPKNSSKLLNSIQKNNTKILEYEFNGNRMIASYEYNSELGWHIIVADQVSNMTRFNKDVAWTMIITCLVAMALMGTGAVFVTNNITGPINQLVDILDKTEQGNLTAQVDFAHREDELGVLGTTFNNMIDKQADIIKQVKSSAQTVSSSSENLSTTIDESDQYIENTTANITELSASIQEIASNTEMVSSSAERMTETVDDGSQSIEKAVTEMHSIRNMVEESASIIGNLGAKTKEIEEIINLITNIAEQTNLLALNATIEAARAGEHGRGFAVVAEEIQNLAEETSNATEDIAKLIRETQKGSEEAITAIEEGTEEVAVGEEVITKAGDAFEEISEAINETSSQIKDSSAAAQQMAAGADQVVDSTENIDDMSKEMKKTSESLTEEAIDLKGLVDQFKV